MLQYSLARSAFCYLVFAYLCDVDCGQSYHQIHALAQSVRKKRSDGFSFEKLLDVFLTTTQ